MHRKSMVRPYLEATRNLWLKSLFSFQGIPPKGDTSEKVGVDGGEGTPVPIPNTEVKLIYADNTWLEAAREDR